MDPGPHAPSPPGIALDYGLSFTQAQRVQLPPLHDRGLTGAGVLIAHFDNGYRLLSHQAFASTRIVARRDFVDGDGDPALPPSAPPGWGEHGLYTLSVVAGNFPGKLIGAAFGADFALARTENDASETPFEEDNWVAAMEWADSLGADVISSSVGYLDYQNPADSWSWQDLNGNTTVVTRAADLAVARGIVVVNAAGNAGFNAAHNTLLAPADGDSVVTVGGVQPDGQIYLSSSVGPTTASPPRIKPDVMAQATAVYIAGTGNTMHYGYNSGTSFAAPMVAGIAALLLEAKPDATPVEIANALRATASRAATPDNSFGWGIVNAEAALARLTIAVEPASMSRVKGLFR
jgi:subtilisin family serine protease